MIRTWGVATCRSPIAKIRSGLGEPGVLAAAFRFQCNRDSIENPPGPPGLAVMERTVALRSTYLQLPFGDQVRV